VREENKLSILKDQYLEKLEQEQLAFHEQLLQMEPKEILTNSYRYSLFDDVVYLVENTEFTDEQYETLIDMDMSLDRIYKHFMGQEDQRMEQLETLLDVCSEMELHRRKREVR